MQSRVQSRAPSIRAPSVHSLHRVPSHAPTLPDGAERMLESLRPAGQDADDDDDEEEDDSTRPQFVLGEEITASGAEPHAHHHDQPDIEVETKKAEIETVENVEAPSNSAPASNDEGEKSKSGWKEVV